MGKSRKLSREFWTNFEKNWNGDNGNPNPRIIFLEGDIERIGFFFPKKKIIFIFLGEKMGKENRNSDLK